MIKNKITPITRQKIADEIDIANITLGGRLNYADFLNRIFDLKNLPSYDNRDGHAYGDIYSLTAFSLNALSKCIRCFLIIHKSKRLCLTLCPN